MRAWMLCVLLIQFPFANVIPDIVHAFVISDSIDNDFSIQTKSKTDSVLIYVKFQAIQNSRNLVMSGNSITIFRKDNDSIVAEFRHLNRYCMFTQTTPEDEYKLMLKITKDTAFEMREHLVRIHSNNWEKYLEKFNSLCNKKMESNEGKEEKRAYQSYCYDSVNYVGADSSHKEIIGELTLYENEKTQVSEMYQFPFMKIINLCNKHVEDIGSEISIYNGGRAHLKAKIDAESSAGPNLIVSGFFILNELYYSVSEEIPLSSSKRSCYKLKFGKACWEIKHANHFR